MASAPLSFDQLEQLWIQQGGNPAYAATAAGIALAESGGDPNALNSTPPDYSVGLYQINYYGSLYQSRTAQFGPPQSLFDPAANTRAAIQLSGNGATWQPWVTDPVGNAAIAAQAPLTTAQVQSILAAAGRSTGGGGGGGTSAALVSASAPAGLVWENQTQWTAPYLADPRFPGLPVQAPPFPNVTMNPLAEYSRLVSFGAEFLAWGFLVFFVLLLGTSLMLIGTVLLAIVLLGPVTRAGAEITTRAGIIRWLINAGRQSTPSRAPVSQESAETTAFTRGVGEGRVQAARSAGRQVGRRQITGARQAQREAQREAQRQQFRQEGFPNHPVDEAPAFHPPRPTRPVGSTTVQRTARQRTSTAKRPASQARRRKRKARRR